MASGKVKSYAPKSRDVIRCHKETSYGGGPGRCREFSWKTDSLRVWGDTSLSCNSIRPRGASLGNSWVSSQPKMRKSDTARDWEKQGKTLETEAVRTP